MCKNAKEAVEATKQQEAVRPLMHDNHRVVSCTWRYVIVDMTFLGVMVLNIMITDHGCVIHCGNIDSTLSTNCVIMFTGKGEPYLKILASGAV